MAAQLTEKARAFLNEPRFAVLATLNPDGTIQQTVMWYALDGDKIVMNTAAGRKKHLNLQRNPHASICVEDDQDFVTISGALRIVEDAEDGQRTAAFMARRYRSQEDAQQVIDNQFSREPRLTLELSMDRVIINGLEG